MFERYTERARRVIFFARYEASQLGGAAIETEHLLLGLIREGKGLTSRLFTKSHLSMEQIRRDVEGRSPYRGKVSTSVEIPLSPESKRVLGHASEEAERMLHNYIATEHILLGLMREERSVASVILGEKGMRLTTTREEILALLNEKAAAGKAKEVVTDDELSQRPSETDPERQGGVFGRFTDRARRIVFFARYEAARLGGAAIENEHLLLGLIRESKGIPSRIFTKHRLSLNEAFRDVEARSSSNRPPSIEIPLSLGTKRALAHAAQEAEGMRHNYIGTEHLLLGLLREKDSLAALILGEKGIQLAPAREEIRALLAEAALAPGTATAPPLEAEILDKEPLPLELTELDRKFLRALKIKLDDE